MGRDGVTGRAIGPHATEERHALRSLTAGGSLGPPDKGLTAARVLAHFQAAKH